MVKKKAPLKALFFCGDFNSFNSFKGFKSLKGDMLLPCRGGVLFPRGIVVIVVFFLSR